MAGFIRRFQSFPGTEVITQIEGVVIVDLPPPGSIQGVGTGVAAIVGEFPDCSQAVQVNTSGVVSTKIRPVEVTSANDMLAKVGGWDETLGDFGGAQGNAFEALRGKKFARLVCVPINLASSNGTRFFRSLPLCTAAGNANPVVPMQGATIVAGREFRNASGRLRIAKRCVFTALDVIASGIGGSTVAGGAAATQVFNATGGFDWTLVARPDGTLGARKGDILVVGHNNAGAASTDAGTYRVVSDPASGVAVTVERLDGANFTWAGSASNVPWRLHFASDADTAPVLVPGNTTPGGYNASEVGGYVVPARPITDSSGAQTDGSWSAGALLTPAVVPTAMTGSSWDPLSGLGGRLMPGGGGGISFDVQLQGINRVNDAVLDAAYSTAIDSLLGDGYPAREVNIIWAARHSSSIASKLRQHVLDASALGVGRITVLAPSLSVQATTDAIADSYPGVGAYRHERVIYTWPGAQQKVDEAVGYRLKTANSNTTIDGILDTAMDSYLVSVLSQLAPERNPGQMTEPVPSALAGVLAMQRGVTDLQMSDYILMKDRGIAGLKIDVEKGAVIQSGVTTSRTAGEKNINRRRMADFIQDSVARRLVDFSKQPLTEDLKDGAENEVIAFFDELLSPDNKKAQRIDAYNVDGVGGNSPELSAKGIHVIIGRVRTTPTADDIVFQTEIGEGVNITRAF